MDETDSPFINREFSVVNGYDRFTYPPEAAYSRGLHFRFSVILHPADYFDLVFDADMFLSVASKLSQAIDHDSVEIRIAESPGKYRRLDSFGALFDRYKATTLSEREAPNEIRLSRNGRLVGYVETEFWVNVGGPMPYHDSYTISFYTDQIRSDDFQGIIESMIPLLGAKLIAVHHGTPEKRPYRPWWKRVLAWFGVINKDCELK